MNSIASMKHRLFNPCVSIFSTKGSAYDEDINEVLENFADLSLRINVIHRDGNGEHNFKNSDLTKIEKQHSNDFFDMIKTYHDRMNSIEYSNLDDYPIILMDDNFVFCDNAFIHLLSLFDKINSLERDGQNWAGFRFSYGTSGIMIQKRDLSGLVQYMQREADSTAGPIHILIDRFFHKINPFGKVYFHKRNFYTYRYQLLKQSTTIADQSTTENNPQCFESLTNLAGPYHMVESHKCANSLFFPCNVTTTSTTTMGGSGAGSGNREEEEFEHDTLQMPSIPPSADYSLSELRRVRSTLTEPNESCQSTCAKIGADCDERFFTFINRCEEIRQFFPNCKCTIESSSMNAPFFYNREGRDLCVLGTTPSRFKCDSQTNTGVRVCPCFRHTANNTPK